MNRKFLLIFLTFFVAAATFVYGQPDGIGQSGASQLLMNGWARSSGLNGLDVGATSGIEANGVNPAGIALTTGTELVFAHTWWMRGSEIQINTFGFSQSLGNGSVLGLAVNAIGVGELIRTTTDQPDGTLGTFSPNTLNISASYAKKFTDHIYVGTTVRVITQSTTEVSAGGVAFDAGIQYRAGTNDRIKLGIALRNIGPTMRYSGDGLSVRVLLNSRNTFDTGTQLPTAEFEIPAVLSLGGSYDFLLNASNTITVLASFNSNSSFANQTGLGLQYKYKDFFIIRGSYLYEEGSLKDGGIDRFDAHTGYAAGITLQTPFKAGKKNDEGGDALSKFSFDISYRTTNPFDGTLTVGARIDL